MPIKNTRELTDAQKESLFEKYKFLIMLFHAFGDMMLRKQAKKFCQILYGMDDTNTDFAITELILNGFLIPKTINKEYTTQMMYLSKYPRSRFYKDVKSGDVPALNFTKQKLYEQIFKIDYIMDVIIPAMKEQDFLIEVDNIITYLNYVGSNLLLANNQSSISQLYHLIGYAFQEKGFILNEEFLRDIEIAQYNEDMFKAHHRKEDTENIPVCPAKRQRDAEKLLYSSMIDQNKYFYHLGNFHNQRFFLESINDDMTVHLAYFDTLNTLDTKKLYTQLAFILLMFQRYTGNNDIEISADVYFWNEERKKELMGEETKNAFDFKRQEIVEETKKEHIFQSIGLLPSNWDNIHVHYKIDDIFLKYHLEP